MSTQVGLILEVNGKDVPLVPKMITGAVQDIKTNGLQLTLPERLNLGEIGQGIDNIVQRFDSDFKMDTITANLPTEFTEVADKLLDLQLVIEEFSLNILPNPAVGMKKISFTIGMSFIWGAEPLEIITNTLAVKGFFLRVDNKT
jgi:hypothetical protein